MSSSKPRLEPLELGQLFDRSLRLYRRNLRLIFSLSGLAFAAGYVLAKPQMVRLMPALGRGLDQAIQTGSLRLNAGDWLDAVGGLVLLVATFAVMSTLGEGLIVEAASALYLGRPIGLRQCLTRFYPKIPRLVLTRLLALAVYGLIFAVGLALMTALLYAVMSRMLPAGRTEVQSMTIWAAAIMFVIGIPLAGLLLWLILCWALVAEVVILEDKAYLPALWRSARMIRWRDPRTRPRRHLARAAILLLAYTAIYSSLDGVVGVAYWATGARAGYTPGHGISALVYGPFYLSPAVSVPFELLITFFDAALQPLVWLAMLVLYYDIRVRHEGYDLELLADDLAAGDAAPAGNPDRL
jgi:hypothetical protein